MSLLLRVAIITGAVLSAGCGSSGSSAGGAPGQFVYAAEPFATGRGQALYTSEPDGSGHRRLTRHSVADDAPVESEPAWSPDGERVAYERATECPERGGEIPPSCFAIWTIDRGGSSPHRLLGPSLEADYLSPTWSPDGKRLAYVRVEVRGERRDLYVVDADGGEGERLTELGSVYDPAWSPDGELIAFSSFEAGRSFPESDLYTVNPDDGEVRRLTTTDREGEAAPDWAPDGERIAYERLSPRRGLVAYEIWVMDADGDNARRVSDPAAVFDLSPVWSPDGRELAFFSDVDAPAIRVVPADGAGRPRTIVERVEDPAFDWAPLVGE